MELDRKAFHFDLDNKSVERFYTGKKNPWSDIQDFLESHCFEKPQYSGYESAENIVMSYQRAYGTVDKMMDKFPWFHRCVKAATFTEIGESYDVKEFLENGLQLSLPLRPETRKELHFDLGTAALSENYNSIRPNAWRGAWSLIRIFMERNGFIHTQYSGYESIAAMPIDKAMAVMEKYEECDRRAIETERIGTTERPEQSALEKAPVKWPGLSFPEIDDCFALSSYFVAPQEEHLYPVVTVSSHASRTCTCSS